jgi:hypothetical protein
MPYDGSISQAELEQRSEGVANTIFNALNQMDSYFEKMLSWADGRTDAQLAADLFAKDKDLDTTLFPTAAELEVFIGEVRALAQALNTISTSVSAGNRASIVKFA